jgi:hypothetical protein
MAKPQEVSNDFSLLGETSDSVVITARIVERGEQFTTVKTASALYTIPTASVLSANPVKDNEEGLSHIRVKHDAKIIQKTLANASRIAGILNIISRPTGGVNLCEQCCTQCCEQCCTQCCEQCCTQCSSGIWMQVVDPALIALAAAGAFRAVVASAPVAAP